MSEDAPARRDLIVCGGLFLATLCSTTLMYAFWFDESLARGFSFGVALMTILLAHEMGHYVVGRWHGFRVSLPWFVPFPNPFGTLGAIIRLESLPKSRQALLEMGAAGPLAGGVVAFLLFCLSLPWSQPAPPIPEGATVWIFHDPLLLSLTGLLTTGAVPDPLTIYHPVTTAGWVGCLLTGINMLPIGQLDGGHVLNALAPRAAPVVSRVAPFGLIVAGYWWPAWGVLGVLLLLLSAGRPLPVELSPPLPLRARLVAVCVGVLFALTFLPIPMVARTVGASP